MRNDSGDSEVVGREVLQMSAWKFRLSGRDDRKTLRAPRSIPSSPHAFRRIYWHGELPPSEAEAMGEHIVEATSSRVPGTLAHRDELWDGCYEDLMAQACIRLEQEMVRLGGHYAHVLSEFIDSKHDGATGESWLHGRFTYMLYRQPASCPQAS